MWRASLWLCPPCSFCRVCDRDRDASGGLGYLGAFGGSRFGWRGSEQPVFILTPSPEYP